MNKKIILTFIFIIAVLPLTFAGQIDLKPEFDQGETLLAKVSGNFIDPVSNENVFFYRQHVEIPLEFDILEINDDYYIYALLADKQQNNYSVRIEGIRYFVGAQVEDEDIRANFTITNETADFSINPGAIITNSDFSIKVQNLQPSEIDIEANETYSEPINLKSGEIKNLNFNLGTETSFRFLEIKTSETIYKIPVFAFVESTGQENETQTEVNETEGQEEDNETLNQENETAEAEGQGNETSENEDNETFVGKIKDKIKSATTKTCEELNGTVCAENQKCSGDFEYTSTGVCCVAICEEEEKSNTGKIIGWSLIGVIILLLIWFFKRKYRRAKRDSSLLKFMKKRR